MWEKKTLDLRLEAFNVLNHTQFSGIDTTARFDQVGAQINALFLQPILTKPLFFCSAGGKVGVGR